ncbi:MAG TPA: hypothetical protein PK524_07880 [Brevefilum fermentans]|nr:hypothetical protein [Brevefilum fermentans]
MKVQPTKIVCVGAGSYSFGLTTLVSLLRSPILNGSQLILVDKNEAHLAIMVELISWLNDVWDAGMHIDAYTHHRQALKDANFVINAIEVGPREGLWESDFRIPLKFGVRQPYAENSGPGGFAHAARNITPIMEIARDMENLCPDAWLINFTNPMARICAAIHRHTRIKVVGLCHQLSAGYAMVGKALANDLNIMVPDFFTSTHASPRYAASMFFTYFQAVEKVKIIAAGVNHFTWMLNLTDRKANADLYPLFRERWQALPENVEFLMPSVFSRFPVMNTCANTSPGSVIPLQNPGKNTSLSFTNGLTTNRAVRINGQAWHKPHGTRPTPKNLCRIIAKALRRLSKVSSPMVICYGKPSISPTKDKLPIYLWTPSLNYPAQSLLMASQEPKSVNCQKESLNSCAGRLLLAISLWTLSCMVIGSWLYRHCCSILSFVIWISHRRYWTSTLSPTGNNCQHSGNKMRSPLIRWGF